MFDVVIKNGKIIDGTGNPAYFSDIALKDGKIVKIAKGIEDGKQIIDAKGLVVTPGFIDSHSHSDRAVFTFPHQIEKIEQGITTSVAGQCGSTDAPISRDYPSDSTEKVGDLGYYKDVYKTMGSFIDTAKNISLGSNITFLVGHSALRKAAIGLENRAPTEDELEKMKELLRDGMDHGALGLSFGLIYTPSCYSKTDELIKLAKVVAEYNGIIAAHIRNEGNFLIQAVEEFMTVIKESGVRGVFSHHKAAGKENWGKVTHTLRMIEEANDEGYEVYCDAYPYPASHTSLSARYIPKELRTGGDDGIVKLLSDPKQREEIKKLGLGKATADFNSVLIARCDAYPQYEGLKLDEISKIHGKEPYETIFDLIEHSRNHCNACFFSMCEEDIETVLAYPRTMIGTDSSVAGDSKYYHPRLRGTFPRVLGRYVRERKVTALPEMIRKMTSMPATVYGLKGKGLLVEGFDGDICIFNPDKIIDRAEFTDCHQRAGGLKYVLINGEVVAENAVYNGKMPGKVILRNNSKQS